jgi:tRNA G18 (ribose-2'-O)-methylase SpoU
VSSGRSPFFQPGKHHSIWKEWRRIGKGKDIDDRFFLEHRQAVLESLESGRPPEQVLLSRELHSDEPEFWDALARRHPGLGWYLLEGRELDEVASVPSSNGLCGVFGPQSVGLDRLTGLSFLLVAWEVSDPGNLGTLIRATRALTEGGLLVVGGCAPWSAKVARASAGSLLKTRLAHLPEEEGRGALRALREAGFRIFAAYPRARLALDRIRWTGKDAVLLGNETRGLPDDLQEHGEGFTIPTVLDVESLNVAMAGSITAWEWGKAHSASSP